MTTPYTGSTTLWPDWQTTYTLTPGDPSKPVVVLLHAGRGTQEDFTNFSHRADCFPYDFNSPLPPLMDLGWQVTWPGLPVWKVELDPARSNVQSWQPFLQQHGFSTVIYSQVDPIGLLATSDNPALAGRPVQELGWVLSDLINNGLTSSGLPASAGLVFLTHSRGGLLVRKYLKDHAQDSMLRGRIRRVVTLGAPHQGSEVANAVITVGNAITVSGLILGLAGAALLGAALAWFGQTIQDPDFQEMKVGSAFLADLASGEQSFPGAVYHTFEGTSVTYTRVRWWLFTNESFVPQWHWPPFDWQAICSEVPGISPVLDCFKFSSPDEVIPGKGDILVADARANLPYSVSVSSPVNHAQFLFDPSVQAQVLNILALSGFSPNEDWTHGPYYGSRGTYFADVTGDGKADAIVVNDNTVTVRRSDGTQFLPNEDWTHGAYYGSRGTFFADVTGDGRADAIVVNDNTVTVRRSDGTQFLPNEDWTHGPYYGSRGTYFADVTGDGKADAIVVNDNTVTVRRSDGTQFLPNEDWTHGPFYGSRGTFFADVNGDGRADAIAVNDDGVYVRLSTGSGFGPAQNWTGGAYYGSLGTFFADVTGDGRADAIVVNNNTVTVRRSNGTQFLANEDWTHGAYYGSRGTFFADVTGDGKADAIVVNDSTVTVRRSCG